MLDPETARQVKWLHATNPKPVQKLSNMRMRLGRYRVEMARFLFVDFATIAVIAAVIVFPLSYFLPSVFSAERDASWWKLALILWGGTLVPPFLVMKPKRPTEQGLLEDIAMRRQVGMDDTVAE
jgi:hypothetical protein